MQGQPITIRKSIVGLVIIYLVGGLLTVALLIGALYLQAHDQQSFSMLLVVGGIVAALGTLVQAYVYGLSRITLTDTELDVVNWNSLVSSNVAQTEWKQVQDVDVKKGGILPLLFDYGTLLVQTAGTERNLRIPMIPKVEYWRDEIAKRASAAATTS